MGSKYLKIALTVVLVGVSGSSRAEIAGPISVIPTRLALKAAVAALDSCGDQGYRITVTVVDREGITRVQLVGDGAGPVSISSSRRKAYTAAAFGVSSATYGKRAAAYPGPPIDPELFPYAGGLPIVSHGAVIGGIGVGGADQAPMDEACAQAGLAAVKDLLD